MNVATHQEKEKNEKTGKKKAEEERGQETNFKETPCYLSVDVQGAARQKMACVGGSARGNWDPRENQKRFRPNPNEVEAAVDWCSSILLALYTAHTTEISHFFI